MRLLGSKNFMSRFVVQWMFDLEGSNYAHSTLEENRGTLLLLLKFRFGYKKVVSKS